MEQDRIDSIRSIAEAAGAAYMANQAVGNLSAVTTVTLRDEDFGAPLAEELAEIKGRLAEIEGGLGLLARYAALPGAELEIAERYRLANRGQEPPDAPADADHLKAIEDRPAA